jgi:hypothetical protein
MAIEAHAHYVPRQSLEMLERERSRYGIEVLRFPPACRAWLQAEFGVQTGPFFPGLLQAPAERIEAMRTVGIDRARGRAQSAAAVRSLA